MRRFFSASFIALALVVGAAGIAPAAHAAGVIENGGGCFGPEDCVSNYCSPENICQKDASVKSSNTYAPSTASGASQPTDPKLGGTAEEGFGKIMIWIMSLFAWLVGVAAITLDYAVFYTVVTMGDYINNLSAVGVTWSILRDIGNIIIIFGFLAIGITTILNVDWYGGGKKMLPMLLVSAVFLNFSLFLSEAVIDTGNLFATQFYTQIKGGALPTAKSLSGTTILNAVEKEGISNKIMGQLGLQTIYGQARNANTKIFEGANSWYIGFMGIILFLVAAFVMFSLAFILIARFVILLFLIIISPIGFAGLAVPQLKNMANKWWGALFEQAITAPVLLLSLYIALAVITDVQFLTGFGSGSAGPDWLGYVGVKNLAGFGSTILSFLVAMGLLLAVVIMSKKLSAFGGSGATKLAGKLTFGLTAAGMRSTAGWGLQAASKRFRSSKLARVPVIGRTFAGALDRGAKASFDVRGATIGGGLKGIGVEAGEAQKGGYRQWEKDKIKEREEHAKTLGLSKGEKAEAERLEDAADVAKDVYEASAKTTQDRLTLKQAQKAASDARGAAQLGYAKDLEVPAWGWMYRNSEAAKNIRKTVEKSKDQQQIDALMNTIRNSSGASGGGTPPPPTPPAGGGGGAAPRP